LSAIGEHGGGFRVADKPPSDEPIPGLWVLWR